MDENECLICLEDLDSKDVAILSCKHKMHYSCLQDWIKQKNNITEICPLCNNAGEIINIIDAKPIHIPFKKQRINNNNEEIIKQRLFCCNIL